MQRRKLLILENDRALRRELEAIFSDLDVTASETSEQTLALVRRTEPDVVLFDLGAAREPAVAAQSLELLRQILNISPDTKIIAMTEHDARELAVAAVGLGAADFYHKPLDAGVLSIVVRRALRIRELEEENWRLRERTGAMALEGIIGVSDAMRSLCRAHREGRADQCHGAAARGQRHRQGAAGARRCTGSRVARTSPSSPSTARRSPIRCSRASCSATRRAPSRARPSAPPASSSPPTAARCSSTRSARCLPRCRRSCCAWCRSAPSSASAAACRSRSTCASSAPPTATSTRSSAAGGFREDLFYRISEVTIRVPPLRERQGDSLLLAQFLLQQIAERFGKPTRGLAPDAIRAIQAHRWPGNVRELENRIKGAVIMAEGVVVTAADLGLEDPGDDPEYLNLRVARQRAEAQAVRQSLAVARGNLSRAAELLGVTRPTLYDLLDKHSIDAAQFGKNGPHPAEPAAAAASAPGTPER